MKRRTEKRITILAAMLAVFLAGFLHLLVIASGAPELNLENVEPDGYLTTILDDNERVVRTLAGVEANRNYVSLERIPDHLEQAFIAIEDQRFYTHKGIDPRGILRAAWTALVSGGASQGGSTITQQLLKNNVFTGWTTESTFADRLTRKIREQYLALKLEKIRNKKWILENYLNTINLGSGTWGVESASYRYFGKDVSQLELSECAVLAGITQNPVGNDPILEPENCRKRQVLVLDAMLRLGYISEEEYDEAREDPVFERILEESSETRTTVLSYFEDALVQSVCRDLVEQNGLTEEEAWNLIYCGGLTIYSTQDTEVQTICEEEMRGGYFPDGVQASAVILSVRDGSVKGVVGGRGEKDASLTLNRATDSYRQPGSTIKIIGEYAAAFEAGAITLGTVFEDAPVTYSNGTPISNANGQYEGPVTVRRAIVRSTNTVALQVFQQIGAERVMDVLRRLGISSLTEADKIEPLALGGCYHGVSNLEMTAAYNSIADDGIYRKPYYYYKVIDRDGNVILAHEVQESRAVSTETAELLTKAMQDVLTEGTGSAASYDAAYSLAAKTGTSSDYRDLWMIGFSPYFTCGVWGGFDSNEAQFDTQYTKELWKNLMQRINEDYKPREFTDDGDLIMQKICTRCGKMAVDGICDQTEAGDVTRMEYYTQETVPTTVCDCHPGG